MGSAGRPAPSGLVLAARQFFQQGLTPFSGVLADRFGAKPLIALGMVVRAVGFAAMAFAGTYGLLMAAAIVSAIGGALFESPRSAAVAALTDESERSSYFAKTESWRDSASPPAPSSGRCCSGSISGWSRWSAPQAMS